MTTKHTPGPWEAVGRDVLSMHAYPRASGPLVCVVDDNDNARWPADSALIAAAPDLLAALTTMMWCVDAGYTVIKNGEVRDAQTQLAVEAIRAAIAKAKGQKP